MTCDSISLSNTYNHKSLFVTETLDILVPTPNIQIVEGLIS